MGPLIYACVGEKGGVGKSTVARLLSAGFAARGRRTVLSDFHLKQQTSLQWHARRQQAGIQPEFHAELSIRAKDLRHRPFDVVVADGAGQGASTSLSVSMIAERVIIPTSTSSDDLYPQRNFAERLVRYGVERERLLFVINRRRTDVDLLDEARLFLSSVGRVASTSLPVSDCVTRAHVVGYAFGEALRLTRSADRLMREVVGE